MSVSCSWSFSLSEKWQALDRSWIFLKKQSSKDTSAAYIPIKSIFLRDFFGGCCLSRFCNNRDIKCFLFPTLNTVYYSHLVWKSIYCLSCHHCSLSSPPTSRQSRSAMLTSVFRCASALLGVSVCVNTEWRLESRTLTVSQVSTLSWPEMSCCRSLPAWKDRMLLSSLIMLEGRLELQ